MRIKVYKIKDTKAKLASNVDVDDILDRIISYRYIGSVNTAISLQERDVMYTSLFFQAFSSLSLSLSVYSDSSEKPLFDYSKVSKETIDNLSFIGLASKPLVDEFMRRYEQVFMHLRNLKALYSEKTIDKESSFLFSNIKSAAITKGLLADPDDIDFNAALSILKSVHEKYRKHYEGAVESIIKNTIEYSTKLINNIKRLLEDDNSDYDSLVFTVNVGKLSEEEYC